MKRRLYHNIEQNKRVQAADDVADEILRNGFQAGTCEGAVWFSNRPLGDGCGIFTGLAIEVGSRNLSRYRICSDGIELYLGVKVYALPQGVANSFSRERWYPRDGELVE